MPDFVDALMESWSRSRPELDVGPMAIVTRIGRVRDHLEGEMAALFGGFGITPPTFVALVTLTRLGPVPEARIAAELGLSERTIGVRLDRLVEEHLVVRRADGTVALADRGQDLVDRVVPAHLDNHARLLSALTAEEQEQLAGLLRKLLVSFEGR